MTRNNRGRHWRLASCLLGAGTKAQPLKLTADGRLRAVVRATLQGTALAVAVSMAAPAHAQSNAGGYIFGTAASSAEIVVRNADTGLTRTLTAASDGTFRVNDLPVGRYTVTYKAGGSTQEMETVVTLGSGSQIRFADEAVELETITVTASSIATIDTRGTETASNFTAAELERIPVERNFTAVQLLAPDTSSGSNDYKTQQGQTLISFGGASPLENAFFINGFNITDFRRGLGSTEVPFEFLQEMQVKTGGYSAEFGRSLGGVINSVSKTGTNTFKAGGNVFWEPDWARADAPDQYRADSSPYIYNGGDERDNVEANLFASGPIIKDRLFFYGLIGMKDLDQSDVSGEGATLTRQESDGPSYYALNLAANLTDGHRLQFTALSDERDKTNSVYNYDFDSKSITSPNSITEQTTGGKVYIANYNGQITDWFSLSALYGHGEIKEISAPFGAGGEECTRVRDDRGDGETPLGCVPSPSTNTDVTDTRESYRIDGTFYFALAGEHEVKVGYDIENLTTDYLQSYAGNGTFYRYDTCETAEGCSLGGETVAQGTEYVILRSSESGGEFDNDLTAYYVEDRWQMTPRLLVSLGIRNDTFDLKNGAGDTWTKLDDQWGTRLGIAFDTFGDGTSKIYANYGRYYMPIETNTAVRTLTEGTDTTINYAFTAIDPVTGLPTLGEQIGQPTFQGNSSSYPRSADLEPTSQDEFLVGYEMEVAPRWSTGIKVVHRKLNQAIEDTCNYFPTASGALTYGCVVLNPGSDAVIRNQDFDFDGIPDNLVLRAEDIGLPKAERKYYAVTVNLDRAFDRKWFLKSSYTWSHAYGNFEGYARSDTGQADPGISSTFDLPQLIAYGDLPNDHRHNLKVFGAYAVTPELMVGLNFSATSGRPKNAYGQLPADTFFSDDPEINQQIIDAYNNGYEGEFAYVDGVRVGRGSEGRLDWIYNVNASLDYSPRFVPGLTLGMDIYNLLNGDTITNIDESKELQSGPNPTYGYARYHDSYQTPRFIAFNLRYEFDH